MSRAVFVLLIAGCTLERPASSSLDLEGPDAGVVDVVELPDNCTPATRAPIVGRDPFCPADHDLIGPLEWPADRDAIDTCNEWVICDVPYAGGPDGLPCYHCQVFSVHPEYLDP